MNEHHYQRIDKGTKRDYRALARRQPRTEKGMFGIIHDPEKRKAALLDALESLPAGESTEVIGARHGIPGSTLRAWILADETLDQGATSARRLFLASELSLRIEDIEKASDPLTLARARESFRAWSWVAERRESQMFGQKQEHTHVVVDLGDRLRRARERVIEGEHTSVMSNSTPKEINSLDSKDPTEKKTG